MMTNKIYNLLYSLFILLILILYSNSWSIISNDNEVETDYDIIYNRINDAKVVHPEILVENEMSRLVIIIKDYSCCTSCLVNYDIPMIEEIKKNVPKKTNIYVVSNNNVFEKLYNIDSKIIKYIKPDYKIIDTELEYETTLALLIDENGSVVDNYISRHNQPKNGIDFFDRVANILKNNQ